jgi:hypothetical protein
MTSIIKVDNLQNQCGANIISESSNVITIGASGDTVTLAAGASQSGFGRSGSVNWDTTAKTTGFTAVSGNGYFCNTTSAAFTVTLPATPVAGDIVAIADYNGTAGTNAITVGRNSSNINGAATNFIINVNYASISFVYVDSTAGWRSVNTSNTADVLNQYVAATGGCISTCGDYKIHRFTGPGTFTVTNTGTGSSSVDYLVVGGGGAGANGGRASGGGAGGFRESKATGAPWTASPLASSTSIPVSTTAYPITVGAGGGASSPAGGSGTSSTFSTITSAGGGGGVCGSQCGIPGASGGGSACVDGNSVRTGGSGNTPPVSPPQGSPGGNSPGSPSGGYRGAGAGGGGATEAGVNAPSYTAGRGGAGTTTSILGSSLAYAGGGGGGSQYNAPPGYPAGTPGGASPCGTGGQGAPNTPGQNATAGTTNRGGGGGGSTANFQAPFPLGGAGGSGVVVIRYKYK